MVSWLLEIMRGEKGWTAKLDTFPLFLNRIIGGNALQRKLRLAGAMDVAGKKHIVDFRSGAILTSDRLRLSAWNQDEVSLWTRN